MTEHFDYDWEAEEEAHRAAARARIKEREERRNKSVNTQTTPLESGSSEHVALLGERHRNDENTEALQRLIEKSGTKLG